MIKDQPRTVPHDITLASRVADVLPNATTTARHDVALSQVRRRILSRVRTTFCPGCGGDKGRESVRCASCVHAAMHMSRADARRNGHQSTGLRGAARSAPIAGRRDEPLPFDRTTSAHPAKGIGESHRQPWRRHRLIDGAWQEVQD